MFCCVFAIWFIVIAFASFIVAVEALLLCCNSLDFFTPIQMTWSTNLIAIFIHSEMSEIDKIIICASTHTTEFSIYAISMMSPIIYVYFQCNSTCSKARSASFGSIYCLLIILSKLNECSKCTNVIYCPRAIIMNFNMVNLLGQRKTFDCHSHSIYGKARHCCCRCSFFSSFIVTRHELHRWKCLKKIPSTAIKNRCFFVGYFRCVTTKHYADEHNVCSQLFLYTNFCSNAHTTKKK